MSITVQDPTITKILTGLNSRQEEAAIALSGETLVIAGAGSGKTAVLTRRCAMLIVNGAIPGSILSLTFTNKAASEMNQRMRKLLEDIGIFLPFVPSWRQDYVSAPLFCTFHSLGVRLLREFGEIIGLKSDFTILDSDDQSKIVKEILKEMNIDTKTLQPSLAGYFISQCKQESLMAKDSSKLGKEFIPVFHLIYAKYETRLKNLQVVDFDDLILLPSQILKTSPEALTTCQNRWQHIQIDEFQDTNPAQFALVELLYPSK